MTREKEILNNQVSCVERYLGNLKKYQSQDRKTIEDNPEKLAALERHLHLATQATIDLGDTLIS
jgi:uncharacterized protein YutE (UPF0331/DUF86 family)